MTGQLAGSLTPIQPETEKNLLLNERTGKLVLNPGRSKRKGHLTMREAVDVHREKVPNDENLND